MSHFAQIDDNNIVVQVIVAEQDVINSGMFGDPSKWIQTSYNTYEGVHSGGGTPLRKNYAGVGYTYDSVRDAFIPPQKYVSWVLNEDKCVWEPPIQPPPGNNHVWNENLQQWETISSSVL